MDDRIRPSCRPAPPDDFVSAPPPIASPRRHDLDALRAVALLLGIALHAGLSFVPGAWAVQDSQPNTAFGYLFSAVHGFRMPLFFLISGFFTAMLWRRRGLRALIAHRFKRIFLPCILGVFTIVPALWMTYAMVSSTGARGNAAGSPSTRAATGEVDFWTAAIMGDTGAIERHLAAGTNINALQREYGATALSLAVLFDQTAVVEQLIAQGVDVNVKNRDGVVPLHVAAFFGRARSVELLLENSADTKARNQWGQTPQETMATDWKTTEFIATRSTLTLNREEVEAGRAAAAEHFRKHGVVVDYPPTTQGGSGTSKLGGLIALLIHVPVFHHLWFLWFLCWLVAGFAVVAWIADRLHWCGPAKWLMVSPARFLWLIPLTMIPQWFMGQTVPIFGPDTSIGILPLPQILAYYAIFFGFGALYYDSADETAKVGKWWLAVLPLSLFVIFPLGLEFTTGSLGFRARLVDPGWQRPVAVALQVIYAWTMCFAFMGLFRSRLSTESLMIRYISDSSYWLYVAHLPLVIGAQWMVRDWPLPATLKFALIFLVVCGVLLAIYQTMVRYTWLGTLLNGRRQRPVQPPPLPVTVDSQSI